MVPLVVSLNKHFKFFLEQLEAILPGMTSTLNAQEHLPLDQTYAV